MKTKHISTAIMGTVLSLLFTALPAYADADPEPMPVVFDLGLLLLVGCIVGVFVFALVEIIIAFGRKKSQESTTQPETAKAEATLNKKRRKLTEVIVITLLCVVCAVGFCARGVGLGLGGIVVGFVLGGIVGYIVSLLVRAIIFFGRKKSQDSTTQPETAEEEVALDKKITKWAAVITLLCGVGLMCLFPGDFRDVDSVRDIIFLLCMFVIFLIFVYAWASVLTPGRKKTETAEEEATLNKKRRKLTALIALLLAVGLMCFFHIDFRDVDSVRDRILLLCMFVIFVILAYAFARAGSVTLTFRRKKKSLPQPETANAVTSEPAQNKEETKEETK